MSGARHLVQRFVGSLRPGGPGADAEAWVASVLTPGELARWRTMSNPDRRHAHGVARAVASANDERAVLAAALLHDVGKVASGLRTPGRVVATVVATVRGRERAAASDGRIGRYLRHPDLGAAMLADAGSDPLTVAWAREHHLPPSQWTVPAPVGQLLKDCDDD
jgi:hypothetical protein